MDFDKIIIIYNLCLNLIRHKSVSSFSLEKQIMIILFPALEMFGLFENFLGIKAYSFEYEFDEQNIDEFDKKENEKFSKIKEELGFVDEEDFSICRSDFFLKIKKLLEYYNERRDIELFDCFEYSDEIFPIFVDNFKYEDAFNYLNEKISINFKYLCVILKFILLRNKKCLSFLFSILSECSTEYNSNFFERSFEKRCWMDIPVCGLYKIIIECFSEVLKNFSMPFEDIYHHVFMFDITEEHFSSLN